MAVLVVVFVATEIVYNLFYYLINIYFPRKAVYCLLQNLQIAVYQEQSSCFLNAYFVRNFNMVIICNIDLLEGPNVCVFKID